MLFETLWSCPNVQFVKMFLFSYKKYALFDVVNLMMNLKEFILQLKKTPYFVFVPYNMSMNNWSQESQLKSKGKYLKRKAFYWHGGWVKSNKRVSSHLTTRFFHCLFATDGGPQKNARWIFYWFCFGELLNFILKILVQANFFSSIEKVCITEWSMTITDKRILRMYRLKCINIVNRDKSTTLINICQRLRFLYFNYLRPVSKCEKE